MNKTLSWKLLLPVGLIIWGLGRYFSDTTLGSAGALLGIVVVFMGLIDAGRAVFKKKSS
jgi:hypothetical protein